MASWLHRIVNKVPVTHWPMATASTDHLGPIPVCIGPQEVAVPNIVGPSHPHGVDLDLVGHVLLRENIRGG